MELLIGNILSFFAACFTAASSWSSDRKRIYLYQAAQCLILIAASAFFSSVSGMTTFALCVVRNLLLAYDRFTGRLCAAFLSALIFLGVISNNRGALGLIPVIATAVYTLAGLYTKSTEAIKLNMIVNLILWVVYDLFIFDMVSAVVDLISASLAAVSALKDRRLEAAEAGVRRETDYLVEGD